MNQITPEQSKALKTWSERRDEILRDISILSDQASNINRTNADGNSAFSELQGRINQAVGRLDELDKLEEHKKISLSKEVADLQVQKSTLQGEVTTAKAELEGIESKKNYVLGLLDTFGSVFATILDSATGLNITIGDIKEKTVTHGSNVETMIANVKKSTDKIVETNEENTKITKLVLDKIPRLVFEMQKPLPVRRVPGK